MESLDPELKTYFSKIKEEIKSEHVQYIRNHPEIRDILNDFLSSLLLEKPEDIYFYARKYFGFFNVEKPVEKHKLLVISGPSGVGKVNFGVFPKQSREIGHFAGETLERVPEFL